MIVDLRTVPDGHALDADVCIVGAGPAGLAVADRLRSTGARVLILESGGEGWTVRGKDLTRGENADPHYYRLEWTRVRAFGGTSWSWRFHTGMRARPMDTLDFTDRPEVERPGWPIDAAELEPYWDPAARMCGLTDPDFSPERWADAETAPLPPPDPDLDVAMFQVAPADAFVALREPIRSDPHLDVVVHATVLELRTTDDGRRVERAEVTSGGGRRHRVTARRWVLAGGGIETPRLLLLSRRDHRDGLGNGNDLVGRYFTEHPHLRTGVLRPARSADADRFGLFGSRTVDGTEVLGFLRPSDEAVRREGLLASAWALHPATEALVEPPGRALVDLEDSLLSVRRITPGTLGRIAVAARHPLRAVQAVTSSRAVRAGREDPPLYRLYGMTEQYPNPDSRVTLGEGRDRYGQPVARVDWRLTERDHDSVRRTQALLDAALRRAGLGRLEEHFGDEEPATILNGGFHHMGTTRMHDDPAAGVVDRHGRVHELANLWIAGSSVFPSVGFANPTLTLVALSLRLGQHLAEDLRRGGEVPT